jgi:hypothetical protein
MLQMASADAGKSPLSLGTRPCAAPVPEASPNFTRLLEQAACGDSVSLQDSWRSRRSTEGSGEEFAGHAPLEITKKLLEMVDKRDQRCQHVRQHVHALMQSLCNSSLLDKDEIEDQGRASRKDLGEYQSSFANTEIFPNMKTLPPRQSRMSLDGQEAHNGTYFPDSSPAGGHIHPVPGARSVDPWCTSFFKRNSVDYASPLDLLPMGSDGNRYHSTKNKQGQDRKSEEVEQEGEVQQMDNVNRWMSSKYPDGQAVRVAMSTVSPFHIASCKRFSVPCHVTAV